MNKKTKIVATIGPASDTAEVVEQLITSGVNVFRFNMKHGDTAWHQERIDLVNKIAAKLKTSVGILIDLQGPEIRISTPEHAPVEVEQGQKVYFTSNPERAEMIDIGNKQIIKDLRKGDTVLIDDGFIECEVVDKKADYIVARALDNYSISDHKGANFPGIKIDLPSLIDQDLARLDMAARSKVDYVALSFCRSRRDIEILREAMMKRKIKALIIAKIESQEALDNLDEIIEFADGVMVARGDLGVEIPIEQIAYWQNQIVQKCRVAHKPVIVATQMLQSMITSPRPTRAEATDVANAIFQGTDAVMLSGETASGKYPVKAVSAMARIAEFNEQKSHIEPLDFVASANTHLIVKAAMHALRRPDEVKVDAIIAFTESGYTARVISSFRPKVKVIAVCDNQKIVEELTMSFGVIGFRAEFPRSGVFQLPKKIVSQLVKAGLIERGNNLLVIHGQHWKQQGLTNAMELVRA